MILKLKFTQNLAILDVTNGSLETVIFDPKGMLGILDLRSMGYYKIKQGILQKNWANITGLNPLMPCVNSVITL